MLLVVQFEAWKPSITLKQILVGIQVRCGCQPQQQWQYRPWPVLASGCLQRLDKALLDMSHEHPKSRDMLSPL